MKAWARPKSGSFSSASRTYVPASSTFASAYATQACLNNFFASGEEVVKGISLLDCANRAGEIIAIPAIRITQIHFIIVGFTCFYVSMKKYVAMCGWFDVCRLRLVYR